MKKCLDYNNENRSAIILFLLAIAIPYLLWCQSSSTQSMELKDIVLEAAAIHNFIDTYTKPCSYDRMELFISIR